MTVAAMAKELEGLGWKAILLGDGGLWTANGMDLNDLRSHIQSRAPTPEAAMTGLYNLVMKKVKQIT
jgi:hypothetical protein